MDEIQVRVYPGQLLDLDDSFRLIHLKPGQNEDPIVVSLLSAHINDPPPYEALSYVWGDPTNVVPIQVTDSNSAAKISQMMVTVNCHAALKRLRGKDEIRTLWIDSICINQGLIPERNHQLELIPKIYSQASRVVVYLGESADDSDTAMDWICDIDTPLDAEDSAPYDQNPKALNPVVETMEALFRRPWFSRVWVLQEIRFAREALVLCGEKEVDWGSFRAFKYWNGTVRWVKSLPYVVQWSVFKLSGGFPDREFLSLYPRRLLGKLKGTRSVQSTDPRDKVFAILPLLDWEEEKFEEEKQAAIRAAEAKSDSEVCDDDDEDDNNDENNNDDDSNVKNVVDEEMKPVEQSDEESKSRPKQDRGGVVIQEDYSIPVVDLYTRLAIDLINAIGLSILSQIISSPSIPGLPSWVPDWSADHSYPFLGRSRRAERQLYGDTRFRDLVWNEDLLKEQVPQTWRFSTYSRADADRKNTSSTQLHVRAISMGKITKLGDMCNIYEDYLPLAQWESLVDNPDLLIVTNNDPWPDKDASWEEHNQYQLSQIPPFVRALAGDQIVYRSAIESAIDRIREYNGEDLGKNAYHHFTEAEMKGEDGKPRMQLRDILSAMGVSYEDQAEAIFYHCHGKRFFVLDSGDIGLAPETAEVGDEIVALEGGEKTFVVRNIGGDANGDGKLVRLVREAYVHGTVSGRGRSRKLNEKDFAEAHELTIR